MSGIQHFHDVLYLTGPHYEIWSNRNQHVLNQFAIFGDKEKVKNKSRIQTVISEGTRLDLADEKLQVDTVQALFLAHYHQADHMLDEAVMHLRTNKATTLWELYPAVMLGTLKAATIGLRKHSSQNDQNPLFLAAFPFALGEMLRDHSNNGISSEKSLVSTWLLGEFSQALADYFAVDEESFNSKAVAMLRGLNGLERVENSTLKLFQEFAHRLIAIVGPVGQITALQQYLKVEVAARPA